MAVALRAAVVPERGGVVEHDAGDGEAVAEGGCGDQRLERVVDRAGQESVGYNGGISRLGSVRPYNGSERLMQYELPTDVKEQVERWMATGQYATEADVLRDAMAALKRRDEELAAIQAGIDDMESGAIRPFEEADAEIRKRFGFSNER